MKPDFFRQLISVLLILIFSAWPTAGFTQSGFWASLQNASPSLNGRRTKYQGDVIFLRGGFDVFSRGLDAMAASLARQGVNVRVVRNAQAAKVYRQIAINQNRFGRRPVILVGHSWGANAAIRIARNLQKNKIHVNYLATFAATAPQPIPRNVRKATNYYFKSNGWGKIVKRGRGMRGRLKNVDLSTQKGIHHFNVDNKPYLQRQVIRNILRIIHPEKRT